MHKDIDQFFRIEEGEAKFVFGDLERHQVMPGGAVLLPADAHLNVINRSETKDHKMYTIYSPPILRMEQSMPPRLTLRSAKEDSKIDRIKIHLAQPQASSFNRLSGKVKFNGRFPPATPFAS